MTELELYKFIEDNNIEWHKQDNEGIEDVIVFPSFGQLETFKQPRTLRLFGWWR